jgi:hypothetical protein
MTPSLGVDHSFIYPIPDSESTRIHACPLPVLRRARGHEEDRRPVRESGIGFLLFVKARN